MKEKFKSYFKKTLISLHVLKSGPLPSYGGTPPILWETAVMLRGN